MFPLFCDTTCNKYGETTTWDAMHNLREEKDPKVLETKAIIDAEESFNASYFEAVYFFQHQIVARVKILPHTDMVRWIIYNVYISDRTFKNSKNEVMESLKPDNLHQMYHLPEPQKIYDKGFIENFYK